MRNIKTVQVRVKHVNFFVHINNATFKNIKWCCTTNTNRQIIPGFNRWRYGWISVLDSLAYITGKLLLVEFLVLYLFLTAAGRIDCRYTGLIWCVILNSCISLWFSRLVLRDCQPSSASNLSELVWRYAPVHTRAAGAILILHDPIEQFAMKLYKYIFQYACSI